MKSSANPREVRHFIGLVNFYKKFYKERSVTLVPITNLKDKNVKFVWTKECESAFERMKAIMAENTMVSLPNYVKPFEVHTDASNKLIGACVSQESKPIASFSRKFNIAQQKCPVGKRVVAYCCNT